MTDHHKIRKPLTARAVPLTELLLRRLESRLLFTVEAAETFTNMKTSTSATTTTTKTSTAKLRPKKSSALAILTMILSWGEYFADTP